MTVAELLQQSRAQALTRKRHAGRADKLGRVTQAPNYLKAEDAAAEALRLRLEAHQLDPEHTDPAWLEDQAANKGVSHEAIVVFLTTYGDIP